MAAGDITVFDDFDIQCKTNEAHDLNSDTFKFALLTDSVTPTDADAVPHFGGTGTTDHSATEVTPGGNYSAGGVTLTSVSYSNSAGVASWNAAKVTIAQDGSNPTNARWAIIYNDTDTSKRACLFCDLGSARDLSAGAFEFRFNSVDGTGTMYQHTTN